MFLEFLSHYNTIVSHMIKHTGLRFLYGILYVLGEGGHKDLLCKGVLGNFSVMLCFYEKLFTVNYFWQNKVVLTYVYFFFFKLYSITVINVKKQYI